MKDRQELAEGQPDDTDFDRLCMVLFVGIAAEALDCHGTLADHKPRRVVLLFFFCLPMLLHRPSVTRIIDKTLKTAKPSLFSQRKFLVQPGYGPLGWGYRILVS